MNNRYIKASGSLKFEDLEFRVGKSKGDGGIDSRLQYEGEWFSFNELKNEIRDICEETGWVYEVLPNDPYSDIEVTFGPNYNEVVFWVQLDVRVRPYAARNVAKALNS